MDAAAQRARVNGVPFGDPRKIIAAWGSMAWDPIAGN